MLELHVWSPAWGLPSIDPECIAAALYMQAAAPTESWTIVPSSDPFLSPSNLLPALNHEGTWTSGYPSILRYLSQHDLLTRDLDAPLRADGRLAADLLATTTHISTALAPLLSLSLYVSSANYTGLTRPLLSKILPFPLPWTVPQLMRAEAIQRTEWMGLGELDKDFDKDGGGLLGGEGLTETFRRHVPRVDGRPGVRDGMTPEEERAIRLFSVVEGGLDGLEALVARSSSPSSSPSAVSVASSLPEKEGGKEEEKEKVRFFKGVEISSADCLAFGYLALMRDAPVSRPFLRECLTSGKYPKLSAFLESFRAGHHPSPEPTRSLLPFAAAPPKQGFLHFMSRLLDSTLRHVPGFGSLYAHEMRRRVERGIKGLDARAWGLLLGAATLVGAVGYGWMIYRSRQPFGARLQIWRRETGFGRFGEVGAMLGLGMPAMGAVGTMQGPRVVDMDSDEVIA